MTSPEPPHCGDCLLEEGKHLGWRDVRTGRVTCVGCGIVREPPVKVHAVADSDGYGINFVGSGLVADCAKCMQAAGLA